MRRLLKRTYYGAVGVTLTALNPLFRPLFGGVGSILTFHRVQPAPTGLPYAPSRNLVVSPDTFRRVVGYLRRVGYDIVTLDQALDRLRSGKKDRPFVCLTLDDGFRDNYELVYPICRELEVPITIYVTTDMVEGRLLLWWYGLSAVVGQADMVSCPENGILRSFPASGDGQKRVAYRHLHGMMRAATAAQRSRMIEYLEKEYTVDFASLSKGQAMTWRMVEELGQSDLVEIGAHTVGHPVLRTLTMGRARDEMARGRDILEAHLAQPIKHFAYPYGKAPEAGEREFAICRELGFASATTTRFGNLFPRHRDTPHSLPRIAVIEDGQIAGYAVTRLTAHMGGVTGVVKSALHAVGGRPRE